MIECLRNRFLSVTEELVRQQWSRSFSFFLLFLNILLSVPLFVRKQNKFVFPPSTSSFLFSSSLAGEGKRVGALPYVCFEIFRATTHKGRRSQRLNICQKSQKGIEGADSSCGHSDQILITKMRMSSRLTPLGHLKKILRKDKNHLITMMTADADCWWLSQTDSPTKVTLLEKLAHRLKSKMFKKISK